MPSFNITGLSTTARTLGLGENGFIGVNGALISTTEAISEVDAASRASLTVLGALQGSSDNAVDFDGAGIEIFVGTAGSITSTARRTPTSIFNPDAITGDISSSFRVVNNGDIAGQFGAIDFSASDSGFNGEIVNSGSIFGNSTAIRLFGGTFGTQVITNTGSITGASGIFISHESGGGADAFINNSGTITGDVTAVSTDQTDMSLVNSGRITGNVRNSFGENETTVINTGLIEGDILLQGGSDFVDSRGGEIVENGSRSSLDFDIDARGGDDTVYGSNLADIIWGGEGADRLRGYTGDDEINGGDDNDDVRGGAGDDFVLGDGGDDMVHGGQGNDRVRGNAGNDEVRGGNGDDVATGGSGDDIVAGGRGDDELYGNSGADVFQFNLSAGFDIIHDYRDGLDMIDLEAFGTRFNRVAAATETVNGNAIIDLSMLGGEGTIVVRGAGGDLDAGDFIF